MNNFSREFIAWFCGIVSTDGTIGQYFNTSGKYKKKYKAGTVTISTAEKDWAERIKKVLKDNYVSCHLLECYRNRRDRTEFRIDVYHFNPKGKMDGFNQWKSLLESIVEYKMEGLIMKRKFEVLKKIAPNREERRLQQGAY